MPIGRREFLGMLGVALTAPKALAFPGETTRITALSSGRRISVHGVLLVSDAERHASAIDRMRNATGYWRRLRYSSTDPGKAALVEALVQYFAAEPDLQFSATILEDGAAGEAPGATFAQLVALASFLTGCVYAEATRAAHPLKRNLAAATLAQLAATGRFRVAGAAV